MSTKASSQDYSNVLAEESQHYESLKDSLIQEGHEGKFIVIKGKTVLGIYEDEEKALIAGLEEWGKTSFLLRRIAKVEPRLFFPFYLEEV